jgi:hypothetical protein|tara:strand:+ start:3430 stop:3678 length:249 start_codon:yes stop_codon:yes gene_type:complete
MYGMDKDDVRVKSVTKDGITKEVKCITAKNGFVVCVTTSYEKDGEYKMEKDYWISKSDPMPDKEKETKEPETVAQAIKNINI